jgi:hypothetical protein
LSVRGRVDSWETSVGRAARTVRFGAFRLAESVGGAEATAATGAADALAGAASALADDSGAAVRASRATELDAAERRPLPGAVFSFARATSVATNANATAPKATPMIAFLSFRGARVALPVAARVGTGGSGFNVSGPDGGATDGARSASRSSRDENHVV